jgi:hypothetical protein
LSRAPAVSVAVLAFVALPAIACKKNVDPGAFDAGASAEPAVASVAPTPSAPAATDSVAPLASLAPAATPPPAAAGAKPKPKHFPECDEAKRWCNHPAHGIDKAIQEKCTTNKQACFAKGGVL